MTVSPQHASQSTATSQRQQQSIPSLQQSVISGNTTSVFQQVKQTQASLARLLRAHQQINSSHSANVSSNSTNHQHNHGNVCIANVQHPNHHPSHPAQTPSQLHVTHQSLLPLPLQDRAVASNQAAQAQVQATQTPTLSTSANQNSAPTQIQQRSATFVDCLIRRFKDCFSEDFCSVPVFVVGSLSPGLDGSHLILPPCVSLSGQQISRFSTPKALRLMNSIKESCKSIEELDLGANKLNDLIEVYKILQYTPNLKFLNLSENDLSRTSPVAIASFSSPATSNEQSAYSAAAAMPLSTLSQNHQFSGNFIQQSTSASGKRVSLPPANRRLAAATAALAQSKKTSSKSAASAVVAASSSAVRQSSASTPSKLASPSSVAGPVVSRAKSSLSDRRLTVAGQSSRPSTIAEVADSNEGQQQQQQQQRRHPPMSRQPSTLHLARSLSSLSTRDVRGARGSISSQLQPRRSARQAPPSSTAVAAAAMKAPQIRGKVEPTTGAQPPLGGARGRLVRSGTTLATSYQPQLLANLTTSISQMQAGGPFTRTFDSIKALALNNTKCQWRTVCSILLRMPNLEELHLSLNDYQRIDLEPANFRHDSLKRLYLCNNPHLTNFNELNKLLAAFPSLEALSMADCAIEQIPDNLNNAREWRKLCGLNINGWPIKEWPVIERLNQLPSLVDLKCMNLTLLQDIDEPRAHLIARLPRIQRLNGSEIEEREFAEKNFLRFFLTNSHLERPSRFHELALVHGLDSIVVTPSVVDIDVDLSPPNTANVRVVYLLNAQNADDILMSGDYLSKLIPSESSSSLSATAQSSSKFCNTKLALPSDENCSTQINAKLIFKDESREIVSLRVDLRQSVRKFKAILCSLRCLPDISSTNDVILYYIDREMVGLMGPEVMKHNQKKLWNYNVQDGDQFIVERR